MSPKFNQQIVTCQSVCLALFVFMLGISLCEASVRIRLDDPKQKIVMMGADMERSANALQSASNTRDIVKWVFEDTEGVDYMRVVYDKHQEMERGQKNMSFYGKQVLSMQQIKSVRPDIRFWATPRTDYDGYGTKNNLPDWIYTGAGYNGGRYDPNKLDVLAYAGFLGDYLEYMHSKGVPIYCLSVMKEWSQVVSSEKASEVIRAVKKECYWRRVPEPIFIGPASWGVKGGIRDLKGIKELGDQDLYAAFCVHDYDKATEQHWEEVVRLAASMGKKVFHDESHLGAGSRVYDEELPIDKPIEAYTKHAVMYRAGVSGEVFFENWSRGVDSENRSIYFKRKGRAKRMRAYWIFREFTGTTMGAQYVPTELITGSRGLETMTFWKGDQVTLWVMNPNEKDYGSVDFQLKGKLLKPKEAISRKYWSDLEPEIRGNDERITPKDTDHFSVTIPAKSLTRIIFTIDP